ncbi:HNH nuclease [Salmonella enterica subsp. enterica serovar Enteritidis str. 22558]|nr:HNH nuclease [Salmonella enterica subsp. enterica serovar Enteritidis str. 22558]
MTSDKTLKQAISNITIWRKGEQRAPHKPLLLLYVLSHYRQGHDRLFDYGSEFMSNCWIYWSAMGHSAVNSARICRSGV